MRAKDGEECSSKYETRTQHLFCGKFHRLGNTTKSIKSSKKIEYTSPCNMLKITGRYTFRYIRDQQRGRYALQSRHLERAEWQVR